ncbi:MAG TPA: hypothetical protein VIQ31_37505, partial [Phormidium sp.]
MRISAAFNTPKKCWAALVILPFAPTLFNIFLILVFWFLCASSALAQPVPFDENLPYQIYQDQYQKGYCLHTYEVLSPNDEVYTCKRIAVIALAASTDAYLNYDPNVWGRHYCWQTAYAYGHSSYTIATDFNGVLLKSRFDFSMVPPPYDPDEICSKTSDIDAPTTCNINITSIINGAFSNKFPLDLFDGFGSDAQPTACPQFTITGQTFQLCYINK